MACATSRSARDRPPSGPILVRLLEALLAGQRGRFRWIGVRAAHKGLSGNSHLPATRKCGSEPTSITERRGGEAPGFGNPPTSPVYGEAVLSTQLRLIIVGNSSLTDSGNGGSRPSY